MATRTRKFEAPLLDDRIDVLNRNVAKASPAQQVYRSVSAILTLIRVSTLVPCPSADSHRWLNQDEMINDKDSLRLSEYCFGACEVLETTIQGENGDGLNGFMRAALEDLERCVD
jgi:hypothetical protein